MIGLNYPTGSIVQFPSTIDVPLGWLVCDGSTVSAEDTRYEKLWDLIGTTFGGTGKSDFCLPNLQGRVPVGQVSTPSGTGINGPIGSWTGAESVRLTGAQSGLNHSHTLTDPGHTHTITQGTHYHTVNVTATSTFATASSGKFGTTYTITESVMSTVGVAGWDSSTTATTSTLTNLTLGNTSVSFGTISTASAQSATSAHSNLQPTMFMKYLIKI